jgi:nucleoside-diphosphate-sugar epimerase
MASTTLMNNKVMVTGASGFVGKRLCEALVTRGIDCVATSRSGGAGVIGVGELRADTDWREALQDVGVVVHLAARVHVMVETESDPLQAFRRANVDGTIRLAEQAVQAGVRRFVYVSSVKVNGEATHARPFSVDDVPAPEDPYGISKREAEDALRSFAAQSGLELVIVRPPLVYGPGVKANFQSLMRAVRRGMPLPIGAVHNRRSMVALDNLIDFLILAAAHPGAPGRTFLVSDGDDMSTATLARKLGAAMQQSPRLVPVPVWALSLIGKLTGKSAVVDRLTSSLQVDSRPCRELLGWTPPLSVDQGIGATVAHFLAREEAR